MSSENISLILNNKFLNFLNKSYLSKLEKKYSNKHID